MGIYLQFYNLKVDDKTHKNNMTVDIKVTQGQQVISHQVETGDQLQQNGEQVTFEQIITPRSFSPGKYHLDVVATDLTNNQTVTRSSDFTVTPPTTNVAVNGTTGR
jgi:hypothetical protein